MSLKVEDKKERQIAIKTLCEEIIEMERNAKGFVKNEKLKEKKKELIEILKK